MENAKKQNAEKCVNPKSAVRTAEEDGCEAARYKHETKDYTAPSDELQCFSLKKNSKYYFDIHLLAIRHVR